MTASTVHLPGSEQVNSTPIDISAGTSTDIHKVPLGETHKVTIMVNASEALDCNVEINGEAADIPVEALTAKQTRIVFTGVIEGDVTSTLDLAVNLSASATTAVAWAEVVNLS